MAPSSCLEPGPGRGAPRGRAGCWQCCHSRSSHQSSISHSLQHLTLGLLSRKGQPPNPQAQPLLCSGVHTLIWTEKASQPLHAMKPCPLQLLSHPPSPHPAPHDEPRAQEQTELPQDIHHPWQLSPLRAQPILYPLGREEWLPQEPLYPELLHIHPSLPGHAQHSLENTKEGKTQSSSLHQALCRQCNAPRRGNYEDACPS